MREVVSKFEIFSRSSTCYFIILSKQWVLSSLLFCDRINTWPDGALI